MRRGLVVLVRSLGPREHEGSSKDLISPLATIIWQRGLRRWDTVFVRGYPLWGSAISKSAFEGGTMELTRIAKRPAVATRLGATVREVCQLLRDQKVGALVVVDQGRLVGIISERDIVTRVIAPGHDPQLTLVSEVMTASVKSVREDISAREALELMHEGRFRHLPLVDRFDRVLGMVSVRDLLRDRIDELDMKNADLIAFISADGPGG